MAQGTDWSDPNALFKDAFIFAKALVTEGAKSVINEHKKETERTITLAKALLEVSGVNTDDPDYDKKLKKQIFELELAKNDELTMNLAMGSIGDVEVVGEKTAIALLEKIGTKLDEMKIPNPFGKKGGLLHQGKIAEVIESLEKQDY